MSIEIHKAMMEPVAPRMSQRKELPPYEVREKKAEANLVRRLAKNKQRK
jgi:hypothetical protein